MCEEATSFDLTSLDIAYCIADVDHLLQVKMDELEGDRGTYVAKIQGGPPKGSLIMHTKVWCDN